MMLKERHRHHGVATATSRRHRGSQQNSSRSSTVAPPEVGIIPANRFFLLPLKKVTALVRPYTPCRDSSATSTKPCIIAKTTTTTATATKQAPIHGESLLLPQHSVRNQAHPSKRLIVNHRHRHSLVAKSPLSTVFLQLHAVPEQEPLLWNNNSNNLPTGVNNNTRSFKHHNSTVVVTDPAAATQHRLTSVFSLNEPSSCREAQAPSTTLAIQEFGTPAKQKMKKKMQKPSSLVYNAANAGNFLRYSHTKTRFQNSTSTEKDRNHRMTSNTISVRSFGRNNRVSPSSFKHGVDESYPGTLLTNFDRRGEFATPRFKSSMSNTSNKSRNRSSKVGCSSVLLHKIQSSSPFLCSFTNEKDLPVVGPASSSSALHLRRLPAKAPANTILAPEASEAPAVPAAAAPVEVSSPGIRAGFGTQHFLDV